MEIKELARRIDGLFLPKPEYPQDPIYFVVSEACRRMRHSTISE
ncbi:MAG: DUF2887 domain-containing protein [Cyanobacteria bacterium P01_D01_bin.50]